jgi:hypothetical protein
VRVVIEAWRDGWRRVVHAPAVVLGVLALTIVLALPLALSLRGLIEAHAGTSAMSADAADGISYDWWQEFLSQATGLGTTFTPAIVGFAAALDNISSVLDAQSEVASVAGALALYVAGWTFLAGGIIDRYARQRRTLAYGFFAASGVYFFRFVRLAAVSGILYWWMFGYVHPWLFDEWYPRLTDAITAERTAFLVRAAMYAAFGSVLVLANLLFDYAKIRAVVEDRRSMLGALLAALRFIEHNAGRTLSLYALNGGLFVVLLVVWSVLVPGAGGGRASFWLGILLTQFYVLARLVLKLQFLASQTALFQASLAHAAYTAAPERIWPESPAVESIRM